MNAKLFSDGYALHKNLFLLICLAMICRMNPSSAQTELGLIGGINFSTLRLDNAEHSPYGFSSDKGFKAGAVLDIGLNRFLSLRMEPMWLQKGAILEQQYPEPHAPAYKSRTRLDYAELPVMFKISPFKGPVQPYLLAGGEAGYLLRATGTDLLDKNAESYDIKSDFKSFDYGVTYGGGIKLPFIGNSSFFIEGRHSIGLSNIGADSYFPGLKTSGVEVMAGVTFPLFPQESKSDCKCRSATAEFPLNGSGANKDMLRKVVIEEGKAFVNFGIKGNITSDGKEGSFTVKPIVRYYLAYKTNDGWDDWENSPIRVEEIPVEVQCPGQREFQKWWKVPIDMGRSKGKIVSYELHVVARIPDCEFEPIRKYYNFKIEYTESGEPKGRDKNDKDAQKESDYYNKKGTEEWRTQSSGSTYGWDNDDNILPPKPKCAHKGGIEVGKRFWNDKVDGKPTFANGNINGYVEATAATSPKSCCCLDETKVELELKIYYRRWYWHKVTKLFDVKKIEVPEKHRRFVHSELVGKQWWAYYPDEQLFSRTVRIKIKEQDAPDCHKWDFKDKIIIPWKDVEKAFLTAQKNEEWPEKGIQYEVRDIHFTGVLGYRLTSEDKECEFPRGMIEKKSPMGKLTYVGGEEPPIIGTKPAKPESPK